MSDCFGHFCPSVHESAEELRALARQGIVLTGWPGIGLPPSVFEQASAFEAGQERVHGALLDYHLRLFEPNDDVRRVCFALVRDDGHDAKLQYALSHLLLCIFQEVLNFHLIKYEWNFWLVSFSDRF